MYRGSLARAGLEKRIPIRVGERVPVRVGVAHRNLIEEHTLAEPELLRLLDDATGDTADVSVRLTLDDLEQFKKGPTDVESADLMRSRLGDRVEIWLREHMQPHDHWGWKITSLTPMAEWMEGSLQ